MGFYCDNCGLKVDKDSEECPRCGVLFRAVKCPRCGFSGPSEHFSKGCPSCGFTPATRTPPRIEEVPEGKHRSGFPFLRMSDRTFWLLSLILLLLMAVLIWLLVR